ncbi:hypothetical protein FA13DRAFT_713848 [Coprinellus micaceus]|uniref:Uncharacterized protein n=1 Tax=Coprinellus micaceus TaxID=71717 RepID=A0A4Y7TVE0_COPMI|nr:hypothetical protein FA13DRAFT_713848 [Coprinellus micaceus]
MKAPPQQPRRDVTMAEGGDSDDGYEPSAELLEALADLDDFAGLLGDEPPESSSVQAQTPSPRLKHEPSQTPVHVKPEPMDEDHFLVQPPPRGPQASPSVRPTPSTAQARVKPEPMNEDHYLAQPPTRGPQPSPSARLIPATVARMQVKPEPMDEDLVPPHSRWDSVPRNEGYKRYDRDDTRGRSPQHHGDRDDYRRSPSRYGCRPHSHSYGSPQARWRGDSDDRRSSDNNHRKRDREARSERRWSNGEGGRQWNKRPRLKVEDTRN